MKKMLSVLLFSLFIVTNLTANHASALTYNNTIDLEYTFNPSLDVSFNTNTGFIIEDLAPGNASYSNTVVITASSNNSDGYNLLASVGDSNDVNRNNNRLVNTNNVNYFESVAADADLELSALGENKWGYAICNDNDSTSTTTTGTCATWSNYNGLPAIVTDTNGNINHNNDITLASSNTAGTTDVLMKIGASATNTQVAGEFTNKINFFVTTNVVTYDYSITYNANDGNPTTSGNNTVDTTNMPANISGSLQTGQTLLVSNQIPTRTGYEFLGWCDGTVAYSDCNGNTYKPSGYIKITNAVSNLAGNANSVNLAAVWGYYIQDFTLALCQEKAMDAPYIVYDKRSANYPEGDNADYTVRYINGQCWMTQNLRIQGVIPAEYSNFTGSDFNVSAYDLKINGNGKCNVDNSFYNACSRVPDDVDLAAIGNGANKKSVGVWYNYNAATVKTISGSPNSATATKDICPHNWHLPSGPSTMDGTDLSILFGTTEHTSITLPEFSPVRSGNYRDGKLTLTNQTEWWTTSAWNGQNRWTLSYTDNTFQLLNGNNYDTRYRGYSVRCVRTN